MSNPNPHPSKPSKPSSRPTQSPKPSPPPTTTTTLSSHLAMVELKHRILSSLQKLSDRDTHQIAIDDLSSTVRSLPIDALPMLLNCFYDASSSSSDPSKPSVVKRESLRLIALLCSSHPEPASAHLPKIISHVVRRLKDSDASVRDACRDTVGSLSGLYLRESSEAATLFVKPFFEAMGEQSKPTQAGAAACLARVVECASAASAGGDNAGPPPLVAFQKMCPRVCKYLNSQTFLAKPQMLGLVSSLSQVGAITPASMQALLQSIRDCLESSDWATRKAAADTLIVLACHSSHLVAEGAASTIAALEACRFDKVKPVRDSMNEALLKWKKLTEKEEDRNPGDAKDSKNSELSKSMERLDIKGLNPVERRSETDASNVSSPNAEPSSKVRSSSISDKNIGILKKKAPSLTDKEINLEFFQKMETRGSDDLPIEVVVPHKHLHSSHSQGEEESELNDADSRGQSSQNETPSCESNNANQSNIERKIGVYNKLQDPGDLGRDKWMDQRVFRGRDPKTRGIDVDDRAENNQTGARIGFSRTDAHSDENRVRGLERIVEEMSRDLAVSSGRRGSNMMLGLEGLSSRHSNKFNGLPDYPNSKLGRGGDGRISYSERFPPWKSEMSEAWDHYSYTGSRNGYISSRRAIPRAEHDGDQIGNRRAWDKGAAGPVRLGEGPSARSVWQASKDEATLEAIRVAGEDNGTSRTATRVAIPELDAEAMTSDNVGRERGPTWDSWIRAMDALHVGDVDSAYSEVLSTGDDLLLVKLMDKSGPVLDQLTNEIAIEVLRAVGQFLQEHSLFDVALSWTQQLAEMVMENRPDVLGIPAEVKRELLLNLNEASAMELPDDWEGETTDQLMLHLASAWGINLQQLDK
ncbi:Microtubule-associated protein TORTIFOLIA1 [Acorus calamus]|uniref:Microtubule-associated protein TORTIFOLIA1 n=1 Tax=Acorus calamus TaxID=4465 RepID=A0AAV9C551_ACOCL|nr:Microtubule-associated protein TORTIFOLIA1 [Acorus calamus]